MQAPKAEQGPQPSAIPPQQIAAGSPLPPQNFTSAPQQYVHPLAPPPPQPYPQQGGRLRPTEWTSGLCACCADQSVCCLTCWCPCITFGQIVEIVDEGSSSCCVSGGIYGALLCLTGFACCYSCCYRTKIRAKYNLSDIPCADCLVHCCCEPCALCRNIENSNTKDFTLHSVGKGTCEDNSTGWGLPCQHLRIQPWEDDPTVSAFRSFNGRRQQFYLD